MILITVTSPHQDPRNFLDSLLVKNNQTKEFVPVIDLVTVIKKISGREISAEDYIKEQYGFTDFDKKTGYFGYIGNPRALIDSYSLGDSVFIDHEGNKFAQLANKNIDWDKMAAEAYKNAKSESKKWNKGDDKNFILLRQKVHMRPSVLVDKNLRWCDEGSFDDDDTHKSIEIYQSVWENEIKNADPDDVFTHWVYTD